MRIKRRVNRIERCFLNNKCSLSLGELHRSRGSDEKSPIFIPSDLATPEHQVVIHYMGVRVLFPLAFWFEVMNVQ